MQVMNSAATTFAGVTTRKYDGVMDCVMKTVRNEGVAKGLYRGQTSMLLREIPGNFCWYGGEQYHSRCVCVCVIPLARELRHSLILTQSLDQPTYYNRIHIR